MDGMNRNDFMLSSLYFCTGVYFGMTFVYDTLKIRDKCDIEIGAGDSASAALVNEASDEQKQRVRRFEAIEKAKRRQMKDKRSSVKRNRGGGKGGWD